MNSISEKRNQEERRKEQRKAVALEVIEIFKSNHFSYLEIEQTLTLIENIAKNRTHLGT